MSPSSSRRRPGERLLRAPIVHFLVIGSLLYAGGRVLREPVKPVIVVPRAELERLRDEWTLSSRRTPTQAQFDALVEQFVRDELLLREARELGWDQQDPVVQRRLVRNLRFLDPDDSRSDADLLRHAFEMEMEKSDIVVRRRLLERMRLAIAAGAHTSEPDDEVLARYLTEHSETFRRPPRLRLTQIFSSRDRHGEALRAVSSAVGTRLREDAIPAQRAAEFSDPFLLQTDLPLWSLRRVGQRFGEEFARSAASAPTREWYGPVPSSYGEHWIWIHEKQPARDPDLDEVRSKVRGAVMREREEERLREAFATLRSQVEVRIE